MMRAQLPLVIAVTLLVFVITTTLFYMTSTLTHTSSIWMKESEESTWRSINEQLDSVIISAISGANETAYMAFKQKWGRQVMSYNDINQSSITYVRRCGRSSITYYTIYDYTSFVRPRYLTRNYDGVGVWYALNNFAGILYNQTLQVDYANAISSSIYSVLNNWASLVRDIGITVIVYPPTVKYEYVFEGDPSTPFSRFSNRLRVNVSLDVFSVNAGYKHFDKYVEYGFNVTFYRGRMINDSFIIPLYITAYVDINGQRSMYIPDPSTVTLRIYSKMLERIGFINLTSDEWGSNYANGYLYASYYYDNGTTLLLFKIPVTIDTYKYLNTIVRDKILNATVFCRDVSWFINYMAPRRLDSNTCCGTGSRCYSSTTQAYLFAGLLSLDINGLTMFSGVKIVWKTYFDAISRSYIIFASLYGDEKSDFQITVPLY